MDGCMAWHGMVQNYLYIHTQHTLFDIEVIPTPIPKIHLLHQRAGWRCSAPPSSYFAGAHIKGGPGAMVLGLIDI